jgi:predicted flap endonuclease-1-like 5' DNA nuclease
VKKVKAVKAEKPAKPKARESGEAYEAVAKAGETPEPKTVAPVDPPLRWTPAPVISRIRLSREAAVVDAPSIGPKTASRLAIIGVRTVGDLLSLAPEDAAARIKASHINAGVIKDWQAQALLACSVPDLNGTNAQTPRRCRHLQHR